MNIFQASFTNVCKRTFYLFIYLMPFATETSPFILHGVSEHPCFRSSLILHRFVEGRSVSWLTLGKRWAWISDVTGLTIISYVTPSTVQYPLVNCDIFHFSLKKISWMSVFHALSLSRLCRSFKRSAWTLCGSTCCRLGNAPQPGVSSCHSTHLAQRGEGSQEAEPTVVLLLSTGQLAS